MINQCVAKSRMVSIPMRFRHILNKIIRIINRITRKELGKKWQTNGKQMAKPFSWIPAMSTSDIDGLDGKRKERKVEEG